MATARADPHRVAAARRWFRSLGYDTRAQDGLSLVRTPAHPATWDANFALVDPGTDGAAVPAALDRHVHGWQVVQVDSLTNPDVEAALALAGFDAATVLIEMAAREVASPHPLPRIATARVDAANWDSFVALVDADQREGKLTGEHDDAVAAGLIDGIRRRLDACDYRLIVSDGAAVGYGMSVACPNGLGLIDSLFTLPDHRGRGLMSAFILDAAARLRAEGCDAVFLDAHAHDTPKRLYARLGFMAVALTRTWVRKA